MAAEGGLPADAQGVLGLTQPASPHRLQASHQLHWLSSARFSSGSSSLRAGGQAAPWDGAVGLGLEFMWSRVTESTRGWQACWLT